ncbi:MAG: hypothetical protein GIW99_12500 [Candidatus Eremiobacteraeota bacterium]|nr:hypothetical protein [Candidatus Eremiobacteraeota bacterium]MBC5828478.1 hypothetical protein [Candidatus Eremiobacteraeota bacterium]
MDRKRIAVAGRIKARPADHGAARLFYVITSFLAILCAVVFWYLPKHV